MPDSSFTGVRLSWPALMLLFALSLYMQGSPRPGLPTRPALPGTPGPPGPLRVRAHCFTERDSLLTSDRSLSELIPAGDTSVIRDSTCGKTKVRWPRPVSKERRPDPH